MFKNSTIPKAGFLFKIYCTLGFLPFKWNKNKECLTLCNNIQLGFYAFNGILVNFIQGIFLMSRLVQYQAWMSQHNAWGDVKSMGQLTVFITTTFTALGFCLLSVVILLKRSEISKLINELVRFRKELQRGNKLQESHDNFGNTLQLKKDFSVLPVIVVISTLRTVASTAISNSNPTAPLVLYSAFPEAWKSHYAHKTYVIVHFLSNATGWAAAVVNLASVFLYVETMNFALNIWSSKNNPRRIPGLKHYRELRVMSRLFVVAASELLLPLFISLATLIVTLACYGAIRFFGRMHLKFYIRFITPAFGINVFFSKLLVPSAKLKEHSNSMKKSIYKSSNSFCPAEKSAVAKRLASMPDLEIKIGSYFAVKRKTYITFVGMLSVNVVTLLINW
ncbi:unnamed protein product [Allacma fusca]|uniref:Uncharacterized protein n=1 Tax=Allacma fusca TaxID=39272 RepID=A0A8J2P6B1_9HEXA|nr:unnamed protein product [Allacma fusca]